MVKNFILVPSVLEVKHVFEGHGGGATVEKAQSEGQWRPSPFLCPLQMNIVHLIIYYHVIGRKFNKLLRALENQYLLNAVYV